MYGHKIEFFFQEILNLEGHPNRITGSRFTAIWLNGWILPIGGATLVEGLRPMGLPRLVNRLGVARAVLQSPTSLIDCFIKRYFSSEFSRHRLSQTIAAGKLNF